MQKLQIKKMNPKENNSSLIAEKQNRDNEITKVT